MANFGSTVVDFNIRDLRLSTEKNKNGDPFLFYFLIYTCLEIIDATVGSKLYDVFYKYIACRFKMSVYPKMTEKSC